MENRLREIAGNLKRDVKDLLHESASIVAEVFKKGLGTANGALKSWKTFTHRIPGAAEFLSELFSDAPILTMDQQPLVTVKESAHEELPVGTRMTLSEAEERIAELNRLCWDSDEPNRAVKVVIDYRMDGEQDRYWFPLQIGPGQQPMLEQMRHYVESSLKNPESAAQDFYYAAPDLSELLHEHFGPQLHDDLEKLAGRVLNYFQQHDTITRLEQQFDVQAQAMPEKEQKRFRESSRAAIVKLRRAANTGESAVQVQEQTAPAPKDTQSRQSVKVKLSRIKGHNEKGMPAIKMQSKPQRVQRDRAPGEIRKPPQHGGR